MSWEIEQLIPHRGAMRLIERLLEWSPDHARVALLVPFDGLFVEDDGMPSWVGIEYMAQAVAAWAGGRARTAGREPSLGFLLGTRRYTPQVTHFLPGSELIVEARLELMGDNGVGAFACRIESDGVCVAQAMVTVFEPDDAQAYLESSNP